MRPHIMLYAFLPYVCFGATLTNAEETCTADVHGAMAANGEVLLQKQQVTSQELVTDDHDDNIGAGPELSEVGLAPVKSPDAAANSITAGEQANVSLAIERFADSPLSVRPGFAGKKPDLVEFAILVKKWYGILQKEGAASVDAVFTLHWFDPRATKLIPANNNFSVTISGESAKDKMWLPNVAVTNIAHGGNDLISSSVKITSSGNVTKVDRVLLTVKQSMETHDFPFDDQEVNIKIASATYMLNEVQLVPIQTKSEWGVELRTDIFNNSNWNFVKESLTAIQETDGELEKSRGVLSITVKRSLSEFVSSVFMPSVVFLFMTWSAFWLPLGGPFVMPRIALNAFALLCQVSVSQLAGSKIPTTGSRVWMTEYLALCIQLQFTLALLNVIIIRIDHHPGHHERAGELNSWMIKLYPLSTAFNIFILVAGYVTASCAVRALTLTGYLVYVVGSYQRDKAELEAEAAKGGK